MSTKKSVLLRPKDVFVPGGLPSYTYVDRSHLGLEDTLRQISSGSTKLVTVTGATKSGKTVLVSTVLPLDQAVWLDGGAIDTEDDLWSTVLDQLDLFTDVEREQSTSTGSSIGGDVGADVNVPGVARFGGRVRRTHDDVEVEGQRVTRRVTPKASAVAGLQETGIPLVIDDFHYLERSLQGRFVRAVKGLIFRGQPIIVLAIPHRRFDAMRVEREMTSRIQQIQVPPWERAELVKIAEKGFPLLNLEVPADVTEAFAEQALGSPHLMQEFCLGVCNEFDVDIAQKRALELSPNRERVESIFRSAAESTGRNMFDQLKRGPRQRSDRKERPLRGGGSTDIYGLILAALARMRPGIETIDYEQLRAEIRNVAADTPPQAHEVSRVLDQMASIAADDEASTPVIDWEPRDRLLHITDPFFAYYLRWGDTAPAH